MSGHSKWHKIRHKKAATDSKKSKLFGQLSRDIKIAARGGVDPAKNSQLREASDRAKKMNLPQGNIDRLLSDTNDNTKSVTYEGYGPSGVGILIATETDNTNRTVAELRNILKGHGGSLGESGSVQWKFSPQYMVDAELTDTNRDEVELALIDAGAEDIVWDDTVITITGSPQSRSAIDAALEALGGNVVSAELAQVAPVDQRVSLSDDQGQRFAALIAELEDHPDVISVFSDAA